MDFSKLPDNGLDFIEWDWDRIKPYFDELAARPLDSASLDAWMADWNHLAELVDEAATRLNVANTQNTANTAVEEKYASFNDSIRTPFAKADQILKDKLLASGLEPVNFDVPLAKMRMQTEIFRAENLPLLAEDLQLTMDYYKVRGAETIEWEGKTIPLPSTRAMMEDSDRSVRERAWKLRQTSFLQDRAAIDAIWLKMLKLRGQIARNAGEPDYRAYRWKQMLRLDYSPDDTLHFHDAIEEVVVPLAARLHKKRKGRMGLDRLSAWDLNVDQFNAPPLKPFQTIEELESKMSVIFSHVDPELAAYFDQMRQEKLLDLETRVNKAPGGYMLPYEAVHRPFIFLSMMGLQGDIDGILHEGGHAFHTFEMARQPYLALRGEIGAPSEFQEVASMGMEFLGFPYTDQAHGGFYTPQEHSRADYRRLADFVHFWPYMSVMDSYQHWVYTHLDEAMDIAACDATWKHLWDRFMTGVDWDGGGDYGYIPMRWRTQGHPFDAPLYYIEYGIAQLGAMQVWANALKDQASAVEKYRTALRLGGSKRLPELFSAAGIRFAFDAETLKASVNLIEEKIEELDMML